MAPSTPATHDPVLSHAASAAQAAQPAQLPAGLSTNLSAADLSNLALSGGLDQAQIMTLLRTFPVLAKVSPLFARYDHHRTFIVGPIGPRML